MNIAKKTNKSLTTLTLLLIGIIGFTPLAKANFMIEPYIGYEMGSYDGGSGTTGDFSGYNLGSRLGYEMLGFTFGADVMQASGKNKPDGGGANKDAKLTDIGVFAGYQFPILVQAYASYFFDSKADIEGYTSDFKGSGYRLGVGYTGLPFVVINFEMINRTYTKVGSTSLTTDLKFDSYALNVSLPLP